jgi:hypothetical protein
VTPAEVIAFGKSVAGAAAKSWCRDADAAAAALDVDGQVSNGRKL